MKEVAGYSAVGSHLRGNDVGGCGNDVGECGNDVVVARMMKRRRGRPLHRRADGGG